VEAVDELEAQRNEQRQPQQHIGPDAADCNAAQILGNVEGNESESSHKCGKNYRRADACGGLAHFFVE